MTFELKILIRTVKNNSSKFQKTAFKMQNFFKITFFLTVDDS